jgi:hypothetical protein
MWTLKRYFPKNVDLNLKNVDLYVGFSEKCGSQPEPKECGP